MGRLFISELKDSPIEIYSIFYYDEDGVRRAYQQNNQMLTFNTYQQAYDKLEAILLERSLEDNALPYNDAEVDKYIKSRHWHKVSVSSGVVPYEIAIRADVSEVYINEFNRLVATIRENATIGYYCRRKSEYYIIGDYFYWLSRQMDKCAVKGIKRARLEYISRIDDTYYFEDNTVKKVDDPHRNPCNEAGSYESNGKTFKFEVVPTDVLLKKTSREKLYDGELFKVLVDRVIRVLGDIGFSDISITGIRKSEAFRSVNVEVHHRDDNASIREYAPLIKDKTQADCVIVERHSANIEELSVVFPIGRDPDVYLKDIVRLKEFKKKEGIVVAIGKDKDGNYLYNDLVKMGNLLIAGTEKREILKCLDAFILSILFKDTPYDTRMVLISPDKNDFKAYADIPHLMLPTCSTVGTGSQLKVLRHVIREMENRRALFAKHGLKDLYGYNQHVEYTGKGIKLARILVVISDVDSLLAEDPVEAENLIRQLPFPQWHTGITIVAASYSPDMIITRESIMDNFPSRIAFSLNSAYESKMLVGCEGAEKLQDYRDIIYAPLASPFPITAKSVTVYQKDVINAVNYLKDKRSTI